SRTFRAWAFLLEPLSSLRTLVLEDFNLSEMFPPSKDTLFSPLFVGSCSPNVVVLGGQLSYDG
ncbi:hypothetical protein FRC07_014237, partial [Ceratobasidium sp. 392]